MKKIDIIKILKDRKALIESSSDMTDKYYIGMYNGIELVLCEFEKREPEYYGETK